MNELENTDTLPNSANTSLPVLPDIKSDKVVGAATPLIVYFRKNWQPITPGVIWKLEIAANCRIYPCESLGELAAGLVQNPELVIIDVDVMQRADVNVHEIINTVRTLHKIDTAQDKAPLTIGVAIGNECEQKFLRELQKTEISGVIPMHPELGISATVAAMQAMLCGSPHWPKNIVIRLPKATLAIRADGDLYSQLTERQQQVLDLVCRRGLSNKSIANMLRISESTVKIHVGAIMKTYGVKNRTQLALAAGAQLRA